MNPARTINSTPFFVHITIDGSYISVEILPCCEEDKVVDYAIWIKGRLEFTITKNKGKWMIAMHNADDDIDSVTVRQIGLEIDKRNNAPK